MDSGWWSMASLLLGVLVGLTPLVPLCLLLRWQMKMQETKEMAWTAERADLLNRCMTREWQSYQMMRQGATFASASDLPVGLSDEEELRRAGEYASNGMGLGDTLVELEADFAELGLRPDGD
jgi:hypothetical protein